MFPYSVWRALGMASAYSRSSASVGRKAIDLAARPRSDGGELGIKALHRWRRECSSLAWAGRSPLLQTAEDLLVVDLGELLVDLADVEVRIRGDQHHHLVHHRGQPLVQVGWA